MVRPVSGGRFHPAGDGKLMNRKSNRFWSDGKEEFEKQLEREKETALRPLEEALNETRSVDERTRLEERIQSIKAEF